MIPFILPLIGAVGKVIKAIPVTAWLILAAFLVAFLYGNAKYKQGVADERELWEDRRLVEESQAAEFKAEQAQVTVETVTEYVDRVKVVREKGETIRELVPVYVPLVDLPGSWRLWHDAAAANVVPDATGSVQAEPVDSQTFARTVTDNYTACHAELEKAVKQYEWSVKQASIPPM